MTETKQNLNYKKIYIDKNAPDYDQIKSDSFSTTAKNQFDLQSECEFQLDENGFAKLKKSLQEVLRESLGEKHKKQEQEDLAKQKEKIKNDLMKAKKDLNEAVDRISKDFNKAMNANLGESTSNQKIEDIIKGLTREGGKELETLINSVQRDIEEYNKKLKDLGKIFDDSKKAIKEITKTRVKREEYITNIDLSSKDIKGTLYTTKYTLKGREKVKYENSLILSVDAKNKVYTIQYDGDKKITTSKLCEVA
jgi:hypothetical protein